MPRNPPPRPDEETDDEGAWFDDRFVDPPRLRNPREIADVLGRSLADVGRMKDGD